jgi:DNA-binding beta-propeller fold protein YncE
VAAVILSSAVNKKHLLCFRANAPTITGDLALTLPRPGVQEQGVTAHQVGERGEIRQPVSSREDGREEGLGGPGGRGVEPQEAGAVRQEERFVKARHRLAARFSRICFAGTRAPSLRLVPMLALAIAVFLALTASSASAARGHVFSGTIGTPCTVGPCAPGELKEPSAVAVNETTGNVYVLDQGNSRVEIFNGQTRVLEGGFDGSATPAGSFEFPAGSQNGALAVDNSCALQGLTEPKCKAEDPSAGDVYVLDTSSEGTKQQCIIEEHCVVDKFTAEGAYLGQITEAAEGNSFYGEGLEGVAVDAKGAVSVYQERPAALHYTNGEPNVFTPPRVFPGREHFSKVGIPGFAVDAQGDFYVRLGLTGPPRVAKTDSAGNILIEELDPEDSSAVAVEQSTGASFVDNIGSVAAFEPDGTELERFGFNNELTDGTGIAVDSASGFAYVADSAAGHLLVLAPRPPGPPTIEGVPSATAVISTGATVTGELNPQSEPEEEPTEWFFEYGPCASPTSCAGSPYGSSTAHRTIEPDFLPHRVSAEIGGLAPGVTYHFRLAATNSHSPESTPGVREATLGPEASFTTQTSVIFALPDSRQWQLVSPADKLGARIRPLHETGVYEAAASGKAITYIAYTPATAEPSGYNNEAQLLSSRGPAGWTTLELGTPHAPGATGISIGQGIENRFFDPELSAAVIQPFGQFDPGLSPEASESTAFLHDLGGACGASCYRPLVTGKPGFANVPAGTVFGEEERCQPQPGKSISTFCGPEFVGATDDLSHVVLDSLVGLTANPADHGGVYEWSAGQLTQVSVLPDGEPRTDGRFAGQHAISADGSRVVWVIEGAAPALYLRANSTAAPSTSGACDEAGRACTLQLDAAEAACILAAECESGGGVFQSASADGSRVFFTDEKRLTAGSGAEKGKADLYECRLVEAPGHLACDLTDLTPPHETEPASVRNVLGASTDGSYVYFVAPAALATNSAHNGAGPQTAQPGRPNLYLDHAGTTSFIATLGENDSFLPRVSPDGHWLELMSAASPTGYDNRDVTTGAPVAEVYLFDAAAGVLRCASCDPTGARPHGIEYGKLDTNKGGLVGGPGGIWPSNALIAANVPGSPMFKLGSGSTLYQNRFLSDSGRLFFNALDGLVPQDSNATEDVYEYEPPGVGGCTESVPTYSPRSGGCVDLISAGTSGEESAFLDASENGDDVFFLTESRLTPQDTDAALDVYDAHVCTAEVPCLPSPPPPAPACEGDACQPPATPPNDATPGSLTFNGAGNVVECLKGKQLKKGKCVAKKSQKKKGKKHKKHHKKKGKKQKETAGKSQGGSR